MHPFRNGDTFATFRNLEQSVIAEIDDLQNDYVAKASLAELEQHFVDKGTVEPLVLHPDAYHIEDTSGTELEVTHDFRRAVFPGERAFVRGTRVVVAIPFEGDKQLWGIRPSTFSISGYPDLDVSEDRIRITYAFPDDSPEPDRLKQGIDRDVASLASAVENLRRDVLNHNNSVRTAVKNALQRKYRYALGALNAVASLGIPMKPNAVPATYNVPTKRRQISTSLPKVSAGPYKPEPTLDEKEYNHILQILRSMALVVERSPESFSSLDEEAIRTHFLLQLNGHYEGTATGETFNSSGKTDILIRVDNRNIFIAECKFWQGPKAFDEAITQLLGYLSWKDSKCSLLVFNKTRNSTSVREKMHEVMISREEHRKTVASGSDSDGRYVFVKTSDAGREIIITTMLFDMPTRETNKP